LVCNHVKVGDFGLVNSLAGLHAGQGSHPLTSAVTPLYASPETFLGSFSPHSDQYSLAIVFQELLTGTLPFKGKNARQLLMERTKGEPDLCALAECDQAAVAKALSKDPRDRFPSCSQFVRALVSGWIPKQLTLVAGPGEELSPVESFPEAARAETYEATQDAEAPEPPTTRGDPIGRNVLAVTPRRSTPASGAVPAKRWKALADHRRLELLQSGP